MLQLQVPFSMLLSGSSGSGKTVWTKELLTAARDSNILTEPFDKVIVAYSQYQPIYDEIASIYSTDPSKFELTTQVPWDELNELDGTKNTCIYVDDMMLDYGTYN